MDDGGAHVFLRRQGDRRGRAYRTYYLRVLWRDGTPVIKRAVSAAADSYISLAKPVAHVVRPGGGAEARAGVGAQRGGRRGRAAALGQRGAGPGGPGRPGAVGVRGDNGACSVANFRVHAPA
jgi:hypothetical protein